MIKEFVLTKTQSKIVTSPANRIEWSGNRGVGKTFGAFLKMLVTAQQNPYSVSFYLTRSKRVARYAADEKISMFEGLGKMHYADMCFRFDNGAKIFFSSFDDFEDDMYRGMRPSVVLDNTTSRDVDVVGRIEYLVLPRLPKYGFILVIKGDKEIPEIIERTYIEETNPYLK